jgi:hypothetical protein
MAAYLRDPNKSPAPRGVEERRLKVYRELIYNNIEGFISGGFPVLRSLYSDLQWEELVRLFMDQHRCRSPYFLEISQEFIGFLMDEHSPRDCDPLFMTELAHYEWVELALDVSEESLPEASPVSDLEHAHIGLSPLAWVLSYRFPVHEIGPGFRPEQADQPTFLVVYRNREDRVKFMSFNGATARLLELLRDNAQCTLDTVIDQLATEINMPAANVRPFALEQIASMLELSVLVVRGN